MQRRIVALAIVVLMTSFGCNRLLPVEPTPVDPQPIDLPDVTLPPDPLVVQLDCIPNGCASLRPNVRMTVVATVTGGSGRYSFDWRADVGQLVGQLVASGNRQAIYIAPNTPGEVDVIAVTVSDTTAKVDPVHAELYVRIVGTGPTPNGPTPDGQTLPVSIVRSRIESILFGLDSSVESLTSAWPLLKEAVPGIVRVSKDTVWFPGLAGGVGDANSERMDLIRGSEGPNPEWQWHSSGWDGQLRWP